MTQTVLELMDDFQPEAVALDSLSNMERFALSLVTVEPVTDAHAQRMAARRNLIAERARALGLGE